MEADEALGAKCLYVAIIFQCSWLAAFPSCFCYVHCFFKSEGYNVQFFGGILKQNCEPDFLGGCSHEY